MSKENPTYFEMVKDYNLWLEFYDPSCHTSEKEFLEMSESSKLSILEKCFGKEEVNDELQ